MPMQLDFSQRGLVDTPSIDRVFGNLGSVFNKRAEQLTSDEEKKFQRDQQLLANKRADAMLGIQQAQEARAANENQILQNTRNAMVPGEQQLQALGQDVVTPEQANKILAAYNKNPKANVQGMVNEAVKAYNASPLLQKQMIQSSALATGVDAQGNNLQTDPTKLMAVRQGMVDDRNKQIADQLRMDHEWKMQNAREGRADARADKHVVYKVDAEGNIVYDTARGDELTSRLKAGWQLGGNIDRAPVAKPTSFTSAIGSPILKTVGEIVGSKDAMRANKLASKLQQLYPMRKDESAALIYDAVEKRTFGDSDINGAKLQKTLVEALAPQRYNGTQFNKLPQIEKDKLYKETAGIITPILND